MNISLRIGVVIICTLVGFVFPIGFALAALVALSIYDEISDPSIGSPSGSDKLKTLTSQDEGWLDHFRALSESPAETAFLETMVAAFDLKPENGLLSGNGLKLRMQVPVSCFRLDFLVDKSLVVEVDGAAYHTSAEAVERDRHRDSVLRDRGFEVLRIPAKIPLYFPDEVVDLVERARALVTRKDQQENREIRESFHLGQVAKSLKDAAIAVSDGVDKLHDTVVCEHEKAKESDRIKFEMETAEELRLIQEELDADEELKKQFDALDDLFNGKK